MRLKASRPEEAWSGRNAADFEPNDLAIRWTVAAQSILGAKFRFVPK